MTLKCIYCSQENVEPSREHVIAAALGGDLLLRADMVCKPCNGIFDREIDRPVRDDLDQVVVDLGIVNRYGTTSSRTVTHTVDGEERKFRVTSEEVSAAERRKLLEKQDGKYRFRATSRDELEQARAEIESRNPGASVTLSDVEERDAPGLPDERTEIDFEAEHWKRWASKTAVNAIGFVLGRDVITDAAFDDLRRHALRGGTLPADIKWGGTAGSENTDELPSRHEIRVQVEGGTLSVRIKLFGYCGLALKRELEGPDSSRTIVLDAKNGGTESDTGLRRTPPDPAEVPD